MICQLSCYHILYQSLCNKVNGWWGRVGRLPHCTSIITVMYGRSSDTRHQIDECRNYVHPMLFYSLPPRHFHQVGKDPCQSLPETDEKRASTTVHAGSATGSWSPTKSKLRICTMGLWHAPIHCSELVCTTLTPTQNPI